jgi:hypothetical protein
MPLLRELYVNTLLGRAGVAVEAVLQRDAYRFVMLRDNGEGAHHLSALADQPPKFFCINDDRRQPAAQPQLAVLLDLCLKRLFPRPSPFERGAAGR